MPPMTEPVSSRSGWREYLLFAIIAISFIGVFVVPKFGQDPEYHDFADVRTFFGIVNFFDVVSNIGFLIVGLLGFRLCLNRRPGIGWTVLFIGVALVSIGSGYYHLTQNNATLVWDRLPMTVGFMGLFVALLSEHAGERMRVLLIPALVAGIASVFYWYAFDDLRFYAWVQVVPLLTVPLVLALFRGNFTHRWLLIVALAFYLGAKITETFDDQIYAALGSAISGHTIKHLLSAAGVAAILTMLKLRRASGEQTSDVRRQTAESDGRRQN
jgi:hypothetical protein